MTNEEYMQIALDEAKKGSLTGEIPIGAVVVSNGEVIATAHNLKEKHRNSILHAEIIAMQQAMSKLNSPYLEEATLYVTIEPCIMCAGAMLKARLGKLVYGAPEPKGGGVQSMYTLLNDDRLNHKVEVISGVKKNECSSLMSNFFTQQRKAKKDK